MPSHPLLIALEQQRKVSTRPSSAPAVDLGALELPELAGPSMPLGPRPGPRPQQAPPRREMEASSAPLISLSLPQELGLWHIVLGSVAFLLVTVVVAFVYYG